jgi:putative MFS transporter
MNKEEEERFEQINSDNRSEKGLEIQNNSNISEPSDKYGGYQNLHDKIICEYGYRIEIWKIIICILFIYVVIGYSATIYPTMINAFSKYFTISNNEDGSIGMIYFLTKATGALCSGFLIKLLKGRIFLMRMCVFIVITGNLLISLLLKPILYIQRIFAGFGSGIIDPIINSLLCEYLPIKFRGLIMLSVWVGYNIGQVIPNLIMLGTMPNYETEGITLTLVISSLIILLFAIIAVIFVKDSPRNLILHEHPEMGFEILGKMTPAGHLSEEEKRIIERELKDGVNKNINLSSPLDLLGKEFLFLTICVCTVSFLADFVNDGPLLILSLTLDALNGNAPQSYVLKKEIIVILITIPSPILAGLILDIKFIGRKGTIFISFVFLIISLALSLIFTDLNFIFLGFYQFFSNYGANMAAIYAAEVFPSKLRDFSVGLILCFSDLGGGVSQYVFLALRGITPLTPYYFSIGCCVVGCIFACLLSVETYERPLDLRELDVIENELSIRDPQNSNYLDEENPLLRRDA